MDYKDSTTWIQIVLVSVVVGGFFYLLYRIGLLALKYFGALNTAETSSGRPKRSAKERVLQVFTVATLSIPLLASFAAILFSLDGSSDGSTAIYGAGGVVVCSFILYYVFYRI